VKVPGPTRRRETEQLAPPQATAPFLDSTARVIPLGSLSARRAPPHDRLVAADGGGEAASVEPDMDIPLRDAENKYGTEIRACQENSRFSKAPKVACI